MRSIIVVVTVFLVVTKLMDVLSTLKRISPTNPELNPLARWLMNKVGMRPAIWLVFTLVVIIIGVATWIAFDVDGFSRLCLLWAGW